jgi:hypothetical protein
MLLVRLVNSLLEERWDVVWKSWKRSGNRGSALLSLMGNIEALNGSYFACSTR